MTISSMDWPNIPREKGRRIYRYLFRQRRETEKGRTPLSEIAESVGLSEGDTRRHLSRYSQQYWFKQSVVDGERYYIAYHPGEMNGSSTRTKRIIIRK